MRHILIILFLVLNSLASATTYYVAPPTATPPGNDSNPGTIDAPWATWGKAFNSTDVDPGDTVYFRGGTYIKNLAEGEDNWYYPSRSSGGTGYNITRSGTAGNYVHFFAYPPDFNTGNVPILDCYNATHPTNMIMGIRTSSLNYVHFKGLTITRVRQVEGNANFVYGVRTGGNGVIFENCTFSHIWGCGLYIYGGSTTPAYVTNCDAHHCVDSLSTEVPGNDGVGFRHAQRGTVYYYHCRAWLCGDQGFSNYIIDESYKEQYTEYDGCWGFRNGCLQGFGHGFKFAQILYTDGNLKRTFKNCIAAFNRMEGWKTCDWKKGNAVYAHLYNNISYHNGYSPELDYEAIGLGGGGYGFSINNTTEDTDANELNRILRNNIAYDNQHGPVLLQTGSFYTHDYNSWDIPLTLTDADFVSLDSTGISGPRQVDGSLPDLNEFLHIASNSKLIGAGVDLGIELDGDSLAWNTPPSLGAYEYKGQSGSNVYPSVVITYPVNNSTITAPATITITANASDTDGTISKVEFYNGITKLGEKTSNPWSFTWNNVPVGTYSLTAVATDNSGAKTTSSAVSIIVNNSNQSPVITISNPVTGSTFTAPATIAITANATDADGSISKVEFFNGATKLGEKTSNPWSFTWNNVPVGAYSLTAVATDNSGAKTTSSTVSVTVNNSTPVTNQPPAITISNPVTGSTFTAPANITITASASDADGSISKVEIFNGTTKLGEKTSNPWSFTWNNVPVGTYSLTAVATDNSGAKTTSSTVSVTVNNSTPVTNQPPAITISNPVTGSTFTAPANITITASASDADGSISKVEIFNGTTKLGEKTSNPWSFTWNNVPAGTYSLTAVATDNYGAKTTSSAVSIIVNNLPPVTNQPPVVTISNPTKGEKYTEPANITINSAASDPDGTISKVEFFNGSIKLVEITTAPYSFTWKDVAAGTYSITAVATDNLNATTTSPPVEVVVEADPFYDVNSEIFNLYPNPNDGHFTINLTEPLQNENSEIVITTLDGQLIYREPLFQEEITKEFDLSYLKSGIYIFILTGNEIIVTKKFIKE